MCVVQLQDRGLICSGALTGRELRMCLMPCCHCRQVCGGDERVVCDAELLNLQ